LDGTERADEAVIRPCLRGLAMAQGWLTPPAQGSAGPFANPRGPRAVGPTRRIAGQDFPTGNPHRCAVGIPDYRKVSVFRASES